MVWDQLDAAFERGLEVLRAHVTEFGTADVRQHYSSPSGFRLGMWLSNKRAAYKAGKLAPERVRQLEALGVRWSLR